MLEINNSTQNNKVRPYCHLGIKNCNLCLSLCLSVCRIIIREPLTAMPKNLTGKSVEPRR